MNYEEVINGYLEALEKQGICRVIGFIGGSDLEDRANEIIDQSLDVLKDYSVAILTGATNFGLPKYATERSKELGLPVIGIYPKRGAKYSLSNLDLAIEVDSRFGDSEWGDSTELVAKIPHGVEVIGGGLGTAIEFSYLMKINEGRISHGKEPIYISTIIGLGGVSDSPESFPIKVEVLNSCIYSSDNGIDAARYLIDKLKLI
jgi:predicted Rossmann-fold nucleotide-binding protein